MKEISQDNQNVIAKEANEQLLAYLKDPKKGGLLPTESSRYANLRSIFKLSDTPTVNNFLRLFSAIEDTISGRVGGNLENLRHHPTEKLRKFIESKNDIAYAELTILERNIGDIIRSAQNNKEHINLDAIPIPLRGALKEVLQEIRSSIAPKG